MTPVQTHNAADAIVAALHDAGVKHVFGFPGETSLPLYVALQRQTDIEHVIARCPRCAAYMAEAYARVAQVVGVCDAPGGIGSPHAAPALHEAHNSSVPLVMLASGVARTARGRWSTSQCDQQELFRPLVKQTAYLDLPEQANERVHEALRLAGSPRTGPVFCEIPADVLAAEAPRPTAPVPPRPLGRYPFTRTAAPEHLVRQAAELLRAAHAPVIVAGGGVYLSGGAPALQALVECAGTPVATTLNGKGAYKEQSAGSLGVTGAKGNPTANAALARADCILAIGTKLGDKSTDGYRWPRPDQTLIHVDCDAGELARTPAAQLGIQADARLFCWALTLELASRPTPPQPPGPRPAPSPESLTSKLCHDLSEALPDRAVIVADASVASGWAGSAVHLAARNQRVLTPRGSGSIGYALPAAIGAQFASPDARVVAIGGDGGLAMAMHEMETAARHRLPLTYLLLDNQRLGLIDSHATSLLGAAPVSAHFAPIDWASVARGFGWQVRQVTDAPELDWQALWSTQTGPVLVHCNVDRDELAPDFRLTLARTHGRIT
jgi:acetolactate synthase-1/2/3 large subunit